MKERKGPIVKVILLMIAVFSIVGLWTTGLLPTPPTSSSNDVVTRIGGITPEERVEEILKRLNDNNDKFVIKGSYSVDPISETDNIAYVTALTLPHVNQDNSLAKQALKSEINHALWKIVRTTLSGKSDVRAVPARISISVDLYLGKASELGGFLTFTFFASDYEAILEEEDINKIVTFTAGKPTVPNVTNVGPLFDLDEYLDSLIPKK